MSILTKNMNTNQKLAIETTEGALMVIAGAGSGKTRVLTHRIAYLIEEKGVYENSILAITFTNKAAKEMKERIYNLVGDTAKYIWINTFHSMCVRILREHIEILGYNKNFTIVDTSEQKTIIKNILKKLNYSETEYDINALLRLISNSKNNGISSKELMETSRFGFMKVVAEVYNNYDIYLKANSVLDFDDLLIKVIELFEKHDDILTIYQNKFKYIHVDEYQDTNLIQYKLIKLLSERYKNICIVGDDDQSIYSWRGASSSNITNFEKDFPNTKVIFLDQNYRSNKVILDAANNVIKNNKSRKVKNLWSDKEDGDKISVYYASNDLDEATNVAKQISKLITQGKNYKDIAILYRANHLSRNIENALLSSSIPYKLIGSLKFLQRQEVKDILAYVNVVVNNRDELSLRRILNVPRRGIGASALEKIENYMQSHSLTMYETLKEITSVGLSKKSTESLQKLSITLEKYSKFEEYSIDEIIIGLYNDTGYKEMLETSNDEYSESRISNISELVSSAKEYSETNSSIVDYVSDMSLTSDSDDENSDNSVTLSTIHASKGLEYDIVFIIGLEENVFPSIRNDDTLDDELAKLEEERRLAYVALTRAKEKLFLSNANRRMQFGNTKYNDTSRFLKEIPTELLFEERSPILENISTFSTNETKKTFISRLTPKISEKTSNYSSTNSNYIKGDRVIHKKFSSGTVVEIKGDSIKVNFDNYGEKTLVIEYANLKKE